MTVEQILVVSFTSNLVRKVKNVPQISNELNNNVLHYSNSHLDR